jgi:magnesium transporter
MIAPVRSPSPQVDVIAYGSSAFIERNDVSPADIQAFRDDFDVAWVNVSGLGNAELIGQIGQMFGLHNLAMEDVLNLHQRPKVEEFDEHIFLVTQIIHKEAGIRTEQLSIFLGSDFVLSFQEEPGDSLGTLRERIHQGKGRVRTLGADYLCYAILDVVVDDYFPVLEDYGEALEALEEEVVSRADSRHITILHDMKRDLLTIRRAVWPHREMVNALIRDENILVTQVTRMHLRDIYDHTVQLIDIVETYREIASGLVDVHISSVSAKLNEIMKVLTIIATIFIPLGFVASLYGMNFDRSASPWNMPELGWRFGYLLSLILMGGIAAGLLFYFRRRGWLGGKQRDE